MAAGETTLTDKVATWTMRAGGTIYGDAFLHLTSDTGVLALLFKVYVPPCLTRSLT